ncbi:MAG: site-specific integrase [Clostridiales bacterium]|jgi:integrase|nr:site-specific integrase [Clostridiales bacterium]
MPKKVKYTGAKHYNERQIEQLLEISKDNPLEIVIKLTLFYGLRRSEVLGLRWKSVDFENKTLAINHTVVTIGKNTHMRDQTKNDSSFTVFPIPNEIILELERWKCKQEELKLLQPNDYQDEGYICTKHNGELISPNFVSQHFKVLLKRNGMPHIRFHDLRHSSASYLKALGFDLKDIQVWLRHKDIQTTLNLYTHLDMEAKTGIADSLDARFKSFQNQAKC